MEREIVGIPCVGGKSKLAPFLRELFFDVAITHKLDKFLSACGGGGKCVFNLKASANVFKRGVIYNEFERGLYNLITSLKSYRNIEIINSEIKKLLKNHFADANTPDEVKNAILSMFREALSKADKPELDTLTSAIYETVVVFGSVQNNRQTCSPNIGGKENGFYTYFSKLQYENTLRELTRRIRDMASFETLNDDCVDLVNEHKKDANLLIYIDPPYFNCVNNYKNAFGFDKHMDLCKACMNADAKIIISMHDAGLAPYLLKLFVEDDWYAYILPPIIHASRKSETTEDAVMEIYKLKDLKTSQELMHPEEAEDLEKFKKSVSQIVEEGLLDDKSIDEIIFCNFEIPDYQERGIKNLEYSVEDDLEMIFGKMVYIMYREKMPKKAKIHDKDGNPCIDIEICKEIVKDIDEYYDIDIFEKDLEGETLLKSAEAVAKVVFDFDTRIRNRDSVRKITKGAKKKD
ncbi:MAG: DNA adenine methylase [Clostridia bacterium]|nr:DNA adenine methylase [Clostridia bacterium]